MINKFNWPTIRDTFIDILDGYREEYSFIDYKIEVTPLQTDLVVSIWYSYAFDDIIRIPFTTSEIMAWLTIDATEHGYLYDSIKVRVGLMLTERRERYKGVKR